jgi:hypothetical protein
MNSGEICVFRFERAHRRTEAVAPDLRIDALAQLIVVDKEMPIVINVSVAIAHRAARKPSFSADRKPSWSRYVSSESQSRPNADLLWQR